ncbi:MAG: hypothetical protein IJJ45_06025 [Clostridia bacterium]|nr:hypothetical protein [Clostridia bacterium]
MDLNEAELYRAPAALTREKDRWEESIPYVSSRLTRGSVKIRAAASGQADR